MKSARLITATLRAACALAIATAPLAGTAAEPLNLPRDGWASWDVPAVDDAPAWCCFADWQQRKTGGGRCDLDGKNHGFGSQNDARTDTVRVYAKLVGGKVERLRALAPTCEVTAATPVRHLGRHDADESSRFLGSLLAKNWAGSADPAPTSRTPERELHRTALAAVAQHRGDAALNVLATEARAQRPSELRRDAVFWIGQTRGEPGLDVLKPIMMSDADANIREHTAFSVAQSKSPRATALLIQQGENDPAANVRSQAWFWLAQTKAPEAERAIADAVRLDPERRVRHQAVFALSQLPGERATRALAVIAENRNLAREERKQALFWLGQSKSPEAMAYLEKVLLPSPQ
ncbi:MAG: HEAT repeat domain-containing protein [Betaproteobacteria bacterium]|nr:HEAT repeat domain-containing protein [Betaproteobacteria bacterium]